MWKRAQVGTCSSGHMLKWEHAQVGTCSSGNVLKWEHAQAGTCFSRNMFILGHKKLICAGSYSKFCLVDSLDSQRSVDGLARPCGT